MPSVNLQISPAGPLVDVTIAVTDARAQALTNAKLPIPAPAQARLLIDTGASNTSLDQAIITSLGLQPTGTVQMHTPSTANAPVTCNQYDVRLSIPHPWLHRHFHAVPVLAADFSAQGLHGLLGRDLLASCVLIYNGEMGFYTLSF